MSAPSADRPRRGILLIGRATLDLTVPAAAEPARDAALPLADYHLGPGGSALNIAVSLRQLGAAATLISAIGDDLAGRLLLAELAARGLATERIAVDRRHATGFSLLSRFADGEIGVRHHEGANGALGGEQVPDRLLREHGLVHLGGALSMPALDGEPAADLLARARAAGARTSLSTTRNVARAALLDPVLAHLDLLFASRREAAALAGETAPRDAARALRGRGVGTVVITRGRDGADLVGPGGHHHVEALAVPVADTTGCGDAFCAGFLAALQAGRDGRHALRLANALGGHCARSAGALPAPFTRDRLETMIEGPGLGSAT